MTVGQTMQYCPAHGYTNHLCLVEQGAYRKVCEKCKKEHDLHEQTRD